MLPQVVLDASAILAVVQKEPGAAVVARALPHASMSAVNIAEVTSWLYENQWSTPEIEVFLDGLSIRELPFDSRAALLTGKFRTMTKSIGLGLGDRACLATGYIEQCPILTADRAWLSLNMNDLDIRCIR